MTVVVICRHIILPFGLHHAQGVCMTLLVLAQDLDGMNEQHHALGQCNPLTPSDNCTDESNDDDNLDNDDAGPCVSRG
jgi:hypothetical protein